MKGNLGMLLPMEQCPSTLIYLKAKINHECNSGQGMRQKQETNKNSITRNYSVCETDDLACQSQVLRSNRLQT